MNNINAVNFNKHAHASVNYAMAREAIHLDMQDIAKSNQARAKTWANNTKLFAIDCIKQICGVEAKVVEGSKGPYVQFSDESKAKF